MARVAFIIALALSGGCFYTDGVNSEPQARLTRVSTGPFHKGDTVVFSASKSADPDGVAAALTAIWVARECDDDAGQVCPTEIATAAGAISDDFDFELPSQKTVRVILTIQDSHGAADQESDVVVVQNQTPTLSLQVQGYQAAGGGYPIGTTVDIFATTGDPDGDTYTLDWRLLPAQGSVPENVSFVRIDDEHYRLDADVTGLWMVEVTITDQLGASDSAMASILVQQDAPPCIASTDPLAVDGSDYILDADEEPRRLAVLYVSDDLDVYPPPPPDDPFLGEATFRWYIASPDTNDQLVELPGHQVADYFVDPALYSPGDRIRIRVEIDDRQNRALPCDPALATCSLGMDGCLQRVTWGVEIR